MSRLLIGLLAAALVSLFWADAGVAQTPGPGKGRLCVVKYLDENNNHQRDPGEGVLSGWTFTISNLSGPVATGNTDYAGRFCRDLPAGTYSVSEIMGGAASSWVNTDPGPNSLGLISREGIKVRTGIVTEVVFGNRARTGDICVSKYLDANRDGIWWPGPTEPAMQGWAFTIRDSTTQAVVATGVTDAAGQFCASVKAGSYVITEEPFPSAWTNTDPGGAAPYRKTVDVFAGGVVIVRFGNAPTGPGGDEEAANIDLCCTPWTQAVFEASMIRVPAGPGFFYEKVLPSASLDAQMHAYIDYLHAMNAATTAITVFVELREASTGAVVSSGTLQWTANSTGVVTTSLFPNLLSSGRTYIIRTKVSINGGISVPETCRGWQMTVQG